MTDTNDEFEKRLFEKVTKLPKKKKRGHSKGGFCGNCMQYKTEGTEDRHGMWHYRCPVCIKNQDPKGKDPCPRCGCTAHDRICAIISDDSHFGERLKEEAVNNPFKPDVTLYRCLNCSFEWNPPEYEKYLLTKAVKYVLPTSEFSENHKP